MVELGYNSLELSIRVDTPVFVWGGSRLMMGLDFVIQGGRVYLIDIASVDIPENLMRLRGDLVNALINHILNNVIRAKGQLPPYVRQLNLEGDPCGDEILDINPEGLPGSEVKGLLKTAYLYHVLKSNDDARNALVENVKEALDNRWKPKQFDSGVITRVFWRAVDKSRGYDVFNRVVVRRVSANYKTAVYCINVKHLNGGLVARVMAIGITPNSSFSFKVMVKEDSGVTVDSLIESLRSFSRDLVEFERGRGVYVPKCELPVRIGFGSGRRWKTVLNLLESLDKNLFNELSNYMSRGKKVWGDTTIKLVSDKPVGWVCVDVKR
ncbi:hypothetical protein [Vulcanisaeta thermophila]|uniref:hypothetical protein n=1 Tax=Vulcanisaeta thermophila TaxID=867917 RepID=UPI000853EDD7|nr:hypothetical protein [Vulcanisaeta thermophila]